MRTASPMPSSSAAIAAFCCALIAVGCQSPPLGAPQATGQISSQNPVIAASAIDDGGVILGPPTLDPAGVVQVHPNLIGLEPHRPSQIHLPVTNGDWTWEQIVDTVDDYFRIERERQVQLVGDVLTEGRIDTFPQIGATILEPHRPDSVGSYNRWESTFQTIRRRATVRVIPDASGYLVDVLVEKDVEDLPHPENATAGAATFRNDNSLPTNREPVSPTRLAGSWILLGRDPALEQQILAEIQQRLAPQHTPTLAAQ